MEISGSQVIAADIETVWHHLNNSETMQISIPGCEAFDGASETGFDTVVVQKVGPIKAVFKGTVTLENVIAKESYRLVAQGKGGLAGYAKGHADIQLSEQPDGTRLDYVIHINAGGTLAKMGGSVVQALARKVTDTFISNFKAEVEQSGEDALD